MSLEVTASAPTLNLATLDQVKAKLAVTDTSSDSILLDYLSAVSVDLTQTLGRSYEAHLGRQTYVEGFGGTGGTRINLSRWPVDANSISVVMYSQPVTDFTFFRKRTLYRLSGWGPSVDLLQAGSAGVTWRPGEDPPEQIFVTYTAGYVLPPQISTWSASAVIAAGSWARPTRPSLKPLLYEATVGGTCGGTEPSWPLEAEATVVDGGVTWAARDARELPPNVTAFAAMAVRDLFAQRKRPADLVEIDAEGFRESYARRADPMPPHIVQKVAALRYQV